MVIENSCISKRCGRCELVLPLAEFPSSKGRKYDKGYHCKKCQYQLNIAYRKKHPAKFKEIDRLVNLRLKTCAIKGYGGICKCCGESNLKFLSLDHVAQDGAIQRRAAKTKGGAGTYRRAIKEGFPSSLQVLCLNCNCGRYRNNGTCPHRDPIADFDAWAESGSTYGVQYRRRFRLEAVRAYGGRCSCCHISDVRFLNLDHVLRDGKQHRKEVGTSVAMWKWARDNNWPLTLRVLCYSCNMASFHNGGHCPHEGTRFEISQAA